MYELIRANDPVLLSYAESLLKDAGIQALIADQSMSLMEGSLGMLQRRLLVAEEDGPRSRRILTEAGLGHELRDEAG